MEKPTCNIEGYRIRYCVRCYDFQEENIPVTTDHDWGIWYEDDREDCLSPGTKTHTCLDCGKDETAISDPRSSHTWSKWKVGIEPTCMSEGEKYRTCSKCDAVATQAIMENPNKHTMGVWHVAKRATPFVKGKKERYCYYCDYTESKTTAKLKASVSLKKTTATIKKGKSITLEIKKKTYGDKIEKWTTSNKKIATVNTKGKVTGKKKGTVTITLHMKSGVKAKCKITVK